LRLKKFYDLFEILVQKRGPIKYFNLILIKTRHYYITNDPDSTTFILKYEIINYTNKNSINLYNRFSKDKNTFLSFIPPIVF